jgi:hypothetical protein
MAHFLASEEKYRDLVYDDDYRSYLIPQNDAPSGYRFARTQGRRDGFQARAALGRINGYFKNMIEAIANLKLRRMERELELRGIQFDRPANNRVAHKSEPTERSR